MDLSAAIQANFMDADGLVSPHPCLPTDHNASNNGLMYLGEYISLLTLNNELTSDDKSRFILAFQKCCVVNGLFDRSPVNKTDDEAPDDFLGLLCGMYLSQQPLVAKFILSYGIHNYGSFDNTDPGHFAWSSMIWRDPSILFMNLCAAKGQLNLLEWGVKQLLKPITAVAIAIACKGLQQSDGCDSWRLTWLLVQVAKRESLVCKFASKLWFRRLDSVWGGMGLVAKVYYQGLPGQDHPFVAAYSSVDAMK